MKEIVEIMGTPQNIKYEGSEWHASLFYVPPFLASSGIYFDLDSNNKIVHIVHYE